MDVYPESIEAWKKQYTPTEWTHMTEAINSKQLYYNTNTGFLAAPKASYIVSNMVKPY